MDIVSKKITYLSKFMNAIIPILILRIIEARLRPRLCKYQLTKEAGSFPF